MCVRVWSLIVSLLDHAHYITTLHNNVTAVCENFLFWFCLLKFGLCWFALNLDGELLKHVLLLT